ncbi:MAG: hypothetical protein M1404_04230 [Acidobacteria bacterium]|nr:hypothetical protein [Acidobacteriota bacterium]
MRRFLALGLMSTVWVFMGVPMSAADPLPSHLNWNGQGRSHENHGHGAEEAEEHGNRGRGYYSGRREESKVRFSSHDRQIIHDYFLRDASNLPPGLAKRGGNLPPGLEKQLRERGTLPPGLEKRLQPFPVALSRRLPPLPPGYSRVMLGARVLLLNKAHVIMDMMILAK